MGNQAILPEIEGFLVPLPQKNMNHRAITIFLAAAALLLGMAACSPETRPPVPWDDPAQEGSDTPQEEEKKDDDPSGEDTKPDDEKPAGMATLVIKTPNSVSIMSKTSWVEDTRFSLLFPDKTKKDLGTGAIRLRGNSTMYYPKKPYNINLDQKSDILGMPASRKWCLMANWMDRTILRNDVAFEIARRAPSLAWTPRGEYVKLRLNEKEMGCYYLCEKIRIQEERVNISKEDGFIVELDTYYDEKWKFHSSMGLPVMIKEPSEDLMTQERLDWFKSEFNRVEDLISSTKVRSGEYRDYLDVDSFIDYWFVEELAGNGEGNHPKSTYMYKDGAGKFYAGPAWDFDWATFMPGDKYFKIAGVLWYRRLLRDPWFVERVKEKWVQERDDFYLVKDYIREKAEEIRDEAIENSVQWPINQSVNGDETLSWEAAVNRMANAYVSRWKSVDALIMGL